MMNRCLSENKLQLQSIVKLSTEAETFVVSETTGQSSIVCKYSQDSTKVYQSIAKEYLTLIQNIRDQLNLLTLSDEAAQLPKEVTESNLTLNILVMSDHSL